MVIRQNGREMEIASDSMEIAAEMVQSLCSFLNATELESRADFPRDFANIAELID